MFDINNGRYGNIRIQEKQEGFSHIKADLVLPKPVKCPFCDLYGKENFIQSLGIGSPNKQLGLYNGKPAIYSIFSERFLCEHCRSTFFADHGIEDFKREKHTLPEFITFIIKEWLKDKNLSFRQLEQKYRIDEDDENEDKGRSAESLRGWCNQIVDKFDQITSCDADETLYFSSFYYGLKNPKLYCLVGEIVDGVSRVCTFLEDYDDFNNLERPLKARFNNLSVVDRVVYDYHPGLNTAMERVFYNRKKKVDIVVDSKRLQNSIISKLPGIKRDCIEDLDVVFHSRKDMFYLREKGVNLLKEWMEDLPQEYYNDIQSYLNPLLQETPDQFNKSIPILSYSPEYYFEDISYKCQKRSGKRERYENMKLRVLYDNIEFKNRINEIVEEESRRIYESIRSYCCGECPFTYEEFFMALCDKEKYAKLYSSIGTKEAEMILNENKGYDPYDCLHYPVRELSNWSVPYFNLAKELEYDDE